ncbi:MAG: DUF1489 family protein [Beijerinckiaceae bacterium]
MALHLIKLCVGCDSIADLEEWIEETRLLFRRLGRPYEQLHTTRMLPRRLTTISEDTSLYWVVKGQLLCRQRLLELRPFVDAEGISRCHLVLEPVVHPVSPRPMRPFQGWRYLDGKDAPADLSRIGGQAAEMPEQLRRELAGMGLL